MLQRIDQINMEAIHAFNSVNVDFDTKKVDPTAIKFNIQSYEKKNPDSGDLSLFPQKAISSQRVSFRDPSGLSMQVKAVNRADNPLERRIRFSSDNRPARLFPYLGSSTRANVPPVKIESTMASVDMLCCKVKVTTSESSQNCTLF